MRYPPCCPPAARLRLEGAFPPEAALAFGLGTYRFDRYKAKKAPPTAQLKLGPQDDPEGLARTLAAVTLVRDLVNTPANDMGPEDLEAAARALAAQHGATISVTTCEELLVRNFPLIHAVGRAATRAPRLIDMSWGDAPTPG